MTERPDPPLRCRGVTATEPVPRSVDLPAGAFRVLTWPALDADDTPTDDGWAGTAVLLHGLSGVAEVWHETVAALGAGRPRCIALDQRGHGRSPHTPGRYAADDYLGDLLALLDRLDLIGGPLHLVGHSMGARVAMAAGARHPERFATVTIVDIGPDAWEENIAETVRLLGARPERFADRTEALAVAGLIVDRLGTGTADAYVDDRLAEQPDGSYRWLSPAEALVESVTVQRRRDHWADWEALRPPVRLVLGGATTEVRPEVAEEMRRRNPRVRVHVLDGIGHNVPMLAPGALAAELRACWQAVTPGPG